MVFLFQKVSMCTATRCPGSAAVLFICNEVPEVNTPMLYVDMMSSWLLSTLKITTSIASVTCTSVLTRHGTGCHVTLGTYMAGRWAPYVWRHLLFCLSSVSYIVLIAKWFIRIGVKKYRAVGLGSSVETLEALRWLPVNEAFGRNGRIRN
jgi:hypothetical protein